MHFPLAIFKVSGQSMTQVVPHNSYLLVNKWSRTYAVGDIIVFSYGNTILVKRIHSTDGNKYWVRGDNESNSFDSRDFGTIDLQAIVGKVVWY